MGAPIAVDGDKVTGVCNGHQTPSGSGGPQPAPPLSFSAPLRSALASTVKIAGRRAAVVGSEGTCELPHAGLHASDPYMSPSMQRGTVVGGSTTVSFDGKPAATASSRCTMCMAPATALATTQSTVLAG